MIIYIDTLSLMEVVVIGQDASVTTITMVTHRVMQITRSCTWYRYSIYFFPIVYIV